jgi:hypothetical protein
MLDRIGTTAVRTLGVDIANLTTRLAVQAAVIEELINMQAAADLSTWVHVPVTDDEDKQIDTLITLPSAEYEKVIGILSLIGSLQ